MNKYFATKIACRKNYPIDVFLLSLRLVNDKVENSKEL